MDLGSESVRIHKPKRFLLSGPSPLSRVSALALTLERRRSGREGVLSFQTSPASSSGSLGAVGEVREEEEEVFYDSAETVKTTESDSQDN